MLALVALLAVAQSSVRDDGAAIGNAIGYRVSVVENLSAGSTRIVLEKDVNDDVPMPQAQSPQPSGSSEILSKPTTHKVCVQLIAFDDLRRVNMDNLPWKSLPQDRYHVEPIEFGKFNGRHWFGRMTLYEQEFVRKQIGFQGGEDRLKLLAKGLGIDDPGSMTANSCNSLMVSHGEAALPYLSTVLFGDNDRAAWEAGSALGEIEGSGATTLLLKGYDNSRKKIQESAAYGLVHKPYRMEAKRAYLDMLKTGQYAVYATQAVAEFHWAEAVPLLEQLMKSPASFETYSVEYAALRSLKGQPISGDLLRARDALWNPNSDSKIFESAKRTLIASSDKEAVMVLALEMALYNSKGDNSPMQVIGKDVLLSLPTDVAKRFLNQLSRSLGDENERVRVKSILDSL